MHKVGLLGALARVVTKFTNSASRLGILIGYHAFDAMLVKSEFDSCLGGQEHAICMWHPHPRRTEEGLTLDWCGHVGWSELQHANVWCFCFCFP